jgi:hypothetical protein
MTLKELNALCNDGLIKYHHTSTMRRYQRVKDGIAIWGYEGKFGKGYIIIYPNMHYPLKHNKVSRQYCRIDYYILQKE